ncbi:MAG: aminoacyl-tRNA hydrolase [Deltaproteobacteria bacterium]|nr:aminoacyl-tRNA hydrolase [Deltaproteobacteria bacterium]
MYLIVGLGNPGRQYSHTRHNIGFMVIDAICQEMGVKLESRKFHSKNAVVEKHGRKLILLKPVAFMNLSGMSVRACADYYHIESENILVIHDDLDMPLGRIKIVLNGGAGGHKGIKSIIENLSETSFPRIKIGIGRPEHGEPVEKFVLSPFYAHQSEILDRVIDLSTRACDLFLSEGIVTAMNRINAIKVHNMEDIK